ncbi:endonuclease/exonuclease/phosphatase family protein [Nonomuraea sp. NPDC050663]|uniref:endonuclease/exonuclease/phosphatase family protein n=1 Tax=Nonomuraea sp. NPDC050663 TaxID=3364370 RepID=UPI0037A46658
MVGGEIVVPRRKRRMPAALAWTALTPFIAWAVTRSFGLERGAWATQVMTATPYAALGSLVPLLLAAGSRRRGVTAVAALTTVALSASVLPRAFGAADAATGRPLRVLSINLLYGRADVTQVMELIRRLKPDVFSAQELTPGAVEALDAAGLITLMPHRVLQPEWNAGGSGLYSRFGMTAQWDLVNATAAHKMPAARVDVPGTGKPVEIIAVHPYAPMGHHVTDWEQALDALPAATPEVIRVLAGDFNASLDHAALRRVLTRGYKDAADSAGAGLIPTWPAGRRIPPIITIDHVLVDSGVGVRSVSVHTLRGTDHRAIFTELAL